jgi:hypothetical protein
VEASIKFKLPEQQDEYDRFMQGRSAMLALGDLYRWLRNRRKHGVPCDSGADELEQVTDFFFETINNHRLDVP